MAPHGNGCCPAHRSNAYGSPSTPGTGVRRPARLRRRTPPYQLAAADQPGDRRVDLAESVAPRRMPQRHRAYLGLGDRRPPLRRVRHRLQYPRLRLCRQRAGGPGGGRVVRAGIGRQREKPGRAAQAAHVPSTTVAGKRATPSPASRRSRFFEYTTASRTDAPIDSPTNQWNNRLQSSCSISWRSERLV